MNAGQKELKRMFFKELGGDYMITESFENGCILLIPVNVARDYLVDTEILVLKALNIGVDDHDSAK